MDNSEQLIDQYLLGELKGKALDQFSQQLRQDEALARAVKQRQGILGIVDAFGDIEMMEQIGQVHQKEMALRKKSQRFRLLSYAAAAAIALAIGIAVWWWPTNATPDQLFANHYQAYELSFTSRNDNNSKALAQANLYYQSRDYQQALPILKEIYTSKKQASKIGLAIGICHMEKQDYQAALPYFTSIRDKEFDLYKDHALWYLALIQLKQNNIESAKQNLQELANRPTAHFHQQAQALLSEF